MASEDVKTAEEVNDEIEMEKNAGLIMGTNNSSIVSKRSVEKLYLPEPHFYRYFVKKPQRRSPTINRGYWLRMRAVDWVVRQFLEKPADCPKIVINLGCGYDPLPFQWMAKEPESCRNTKFVDIDYEELMLTKRAIIANTTRMREMLSTMTTESANDKSILLESEEYVAIGCDLRNLPRLERLLKSVVDYGRCCVLCVAEVSVAYMHTGAADSLIAFTSTLSPDVTFCLLEQGSPDRPDHPFTATMMKHFQKLGTPLHNVFEYPGVHTQASRFQRAGFSHCETHNLWELWSDSRFLSPSQRLALDLVEPFDEWEELALFASHYLLVVAHNRPELDSSDFRRSRRDSVASNASDISARTSSPWNNQAAWFAMKYVEDTSGDAKRHHGTAYQVPDQDAIATYGGIGPKGRLATTTICRTVQNQHDPPVVIAESLGPRCCHTVTTLGNGWNIMVGGRNSPTQPKKDCWLQVGSTWQRIHDLPEPRYRHRTCPVTLSHDIYGAVVFGGKTDASKVAVDVLLWDPRTGWEVLRSLHQDPIPRFGASFVFLGFNHGLLFGGMRQDGVVCQGLWRWRLIIRDAKVAGISFRPSKALDATVGSYSWFARLGASWGLIRDELLIIGGVAKGGCIPQPFEIQSILGSFSAFGEHEKEMRLNLTCVSPTMPPNCPRPLLVGHSTHRTQYGILVLLGGGATCFSFGNHYNSGAWILHQREPGLNTDWSLVKGIQGTTDDTVEAKQEQKPTEKSPALSKPVIKSVKDGNVENAEEFLGLIQKSRPAVLHRLDLGSCLSTWSPSYLRSKVNPTRSVVVHNSPARNMNFQKKDFSYQTLSFKSFVSMLEMPDSHLYLRALSSANPTTMPANFETDWPELSPDFEIPQQFSPILTRHIHSSCLRIANNITMWLHYDVMANVLFQIHGIKKLVLFPPSDIQNLSFSAGSTTSDIDIWPSQKTTGKNDVTNGSDRDDTNFMTPEGTSPYVVILKPGDALFIPPLWPHTGISLEHDDTNLGHTSTALSTSSHSVHTSSLDSSQTVRKATAEVAAAPVPTPNPSSPPALTRPSISPPQPATNQYPNIALNIFFRTLPSTRYAAGRDIYGNRDLSAYEDGRRDIDRVVRRFLTSSSTTSSGGAKIKVYKNGNGNSEDSANPTAQGDENAASADAGVNVGDIFDSIPVDVAKAYLERLADELKKKASEL